MTDPLTELIRDAHRALLAARVDTAAPAALDAAIAEVDAILTERGQPPRPSRTEDPEVPR